MTCFANEFRADLFAADFDGYCAGDAAQYWKRKCTRTKLARGEGRVAQADGGPQEENVRRP